MDRVKALEKEHTITGKPFPLKQRQSLEIFLKSGNGQTQMETRYTAPRTHFHLSDENLSITAYFITTPENHIEYQLLSSPVNAGIVFDDPSLGFGMLGLQYGSEHSWPWQTQVIPF